MLGSSHALRGTNPPNYLQSGDPGTNGGGTLTRQNTDMTIDDYANIFGPSARDIKEDLQKYKRHGRWHIPDILKGRNEYLTERVDGLITDATNSPFTTSILPYKYMENPDGKIKWNVWSFDEGMATRVPYESAARTLTQTKRSYAGYTVRQGMAIKLEHNFMMTPEGRVNFQRQLNQMIGSIQYTNDFDVHVALILAPSYAKIMREKYFVSDDRSPEQLARSYVDMYGFIQKNPNALDILIEEAKTVLKTWGSPPPTFMLCNSNLTFQLTMTPEKTQYITQGWDGVKRLRDGPDLASYRGVKIIHSRHFATETGGMPRDLMRRRVRVAEYYRIKADPLNKFRKFQIYNEGRDSWVTFTWADLVRAARVEQSDPSPADNAVPVGGIVRLSGRAPGGPKRRRTGGRPGGRWPGLAEEAGAGSDSDDGGDDGGGEGGDDTRLASRRKGGLRSRNVDAYYAPSAYTRAFHHDCPLFFCAEIYENQAPRDERLITSIVPATNFEKAAFTKNVYTPTCVKYPASGYVETWLLNNGTLIQEAQDAFNKVKPKEFAQDGADMNPIFHYQNYYRYQFPEYSSDSAEASATNYLPVTINGTQYATHDLYRQMYAWRNGPAFSEVNRRFLHRALNGFYAVSDENKAQMLRMLKGQEPVGRIKSFFRRDIGTVLHANAIPNPDAYFTEDSGILLQEERILREFVLSDELVKRLMSEVKVTEDITLKGVLEQDVEMAVMFNSKGLVKLSSCHNTLLSALGIISRKNSPLQTTSINGYQPSFFDEEITLTDNDLRDYRSMSLSLNNQILDKLANMQKDVKPNQTYFHLWCLPTTCLRNGMQEETEREDCRRMLDSFPQSTKNWEVYKTIAEKGVIPKALLDSEGDNYWEELKRIFPKSDDKTYGSKSFKLKMKTVMRWLFHRIYSDSNMERQTGSYLPEGRVGARTGKRADAGPFDRRSVDPGSDRGGSGSYAPGQGGDDGSYGGGYDDNYHDAPSDPPSPAGGGGGSHDPTDDYEIVILRPNIEHHMLGIILGRGGEELGHTYWGQTELSCYDDSMHGIWGMSYKYHERAVVHNERNLVRLWDIAYDGYCGGKDDTFVHWLGADRNARNHPDTFNKDTNERNLSYKGVSMMVMSFPKKPSRNEAAPSNWPSPIVFYPHNKSDVIPLDEDGQSFNGGREYTVFEEEFYRERFEKYKRKMPHFNMLTSVRKDAGSCTINGETTTNALAFQGTMQTIEPGGALTLINGSGHHGVDYVGVASVRNGKGHRFQSQPAQMRIM